MKKLIAVLLTILMLTGAASAFAEDYAFGTDTAFRPFEYTDETGTLVGIDVEIPDRLAAFMKGEKQSVPMTKDFDDFKKYLMNQ